MENNDAGRRTPVDVPEEDLTMAVALAKRAARRFPTMDVYDDFVGASWLALVQRDPGESPYFTIRRAIHREIKHLPGMIPKRGQGVRHVSLDVEPYYEDDRFAQVQWTDRREALFAILPEREAAVFGEMFGEDEYRPQLTVAQKLGLSQMTVSRAYRSGLSLLREQLS